VNILLGNKSIEKVEDFSYLGTTLTELNFIYKEILEQLLKKTNEMHKQYILFLNIFHLHVSVTFDHHQGACVTEYHNLTVCAIVQDSYL
jgi:hypothetical protein